MTTGKLPLKIGNASGFWGDDPYALERQVNKGDIHYITMDFLAEITMSILQKQQSRAPELGYAKDFVTMVEPLLKTIKKKGIKLISNAGGINPFECAKKIKQAAKKQSVDIKVAVVHGDDIQAQLVELQENGAHLDNMETGEKFAELDHSIDAANIYFGAYPVVEALKNYDPDIIVTGRVTDTGITLACMIHEFGWAWNDYDKLAKGVVAGHILECGSQATGGNFTDWQLVPSYNEMGFPIVEVQENGDFTVTKHPGTGGLVSKDTVREQLFYEMGDPKNYLTPDVVADFSTIKLIDDGPNRVLVTNVQGLESTPFYKVSMAFEDGYKCVTSLLISGPDAQSKAQAFSKIFWERFTLPVEAKETEFIGWNACHSHFDTQHAPNEILLRLGVRDADRLKVQAFRKLVPALILSGPPGVCVLSEGSKLQTVVRYWPALISKELVYPRIAYLGEQSQEQILKDQPSGIYQTINSDTQTASACQGKYEEPSKGTLLSELCLARSGDKGDMVNIGLLARSSKAYDFLNEFATAQKIKDIFQEMCEGTVTRYQLPNMQGFNYLLDSSLKGGGSCSLKADAQGKTFAQALLRIKVPFTES